MKTLVQAKLYPIQITRATYGGGDRNTVEFNLNNINWAVLKNRINIENAFSLSTIFLKVPPAGDDTTAYYRAYESQYSLNTVKIIPPSTEPTGVNVENYLTTPLKDTINRLTDYDMPHPFNTFMAIDEAVNPTNISGFMWIKCNVSPYVVQGNQFWNQNYAWFRLSPDWKKPTIFNAEIRQGGAIVTSVDPRQPIELSWVSSIQDDGEVQVWQAGSYLATIPVGISKACTIPGNTVKNVGEFTLKIVAMNNPMEDLGTTNLLEVKSTAAVPSVTGSNLKVDQFEKRTPMVGTWDSTNQSDFKLEVIRDNNIIYTLMGGAEKTFTIHPGSLSEGPVTFKLTLNNTFGSATSSVILNLAKTIIFSKPLITSLEPDKLNQNLDLPLDITWICDNQGDYNLKVYHEDILQREFSGTVEKSITLPGKTLKPGNVKLVIVINNVINNIKGTSVREATFFGYGTPDSPVFEDIDVYNQTLPIVKWVSPDQEYYDLKILNMDNTVHESTGEILSNNKQYQITKDLANNVQYKLRLRIKSTFGIWSNWTEKVINVSYSQLTKPIIEVVGDDEGNIIVTIKNPNVTEFFSAEIWRKEGYGDWVRLVKDLPPNNVWNDPTAAAFINYSYRCVANSRDGGRTQSDIVNISVTLQGYHLIDVENPDRRIELLIEDTESDSPVELNQIGDEVFSLFVGSSKPIMEKGIINYKTATMKFLLPVKDYLLLSDMKKNSKLLLYKDEKGHKLYGNIQGNLLETPKRWFNDYVDVSFSFTENAFLEQDIASNVKMVLHLFNGMWKFDGTIDMTGRHWEVL